MRTALALLLFVASPLCPAQKWKDENGKIYYGTPPAGLAVTRVPMEGGTTSTVGAQRATGAAQPQYPLEPDSSRPRVSVIDRGGPAPAQPPRESPYVGDYEPPERETPSQVPRSPMRGNEHPKR